MKFRCEHCGTKYSLDEETIRGRVLKIRCRQCKGVMVVRDPERSIGALDSMSAEDLRSALSKSGEVPAGDAQEWFLAKDGERQGPMNTLEIKERLERSEFGPKDHAWRSGMSGWLPLRDVPELATLLDKTGVSSVVEAVLPSRAPTLPVEPVVDPEQPAPPQPAAEEPVVAQPVEPEAKRDKPVPTMPSDPAAEPAWVGREVKDDGHAEESVASQSAAPFINEPSLSSIGEETRLFLLASGLQQGARRRRVIFGVILLGLVGLGVGMNQGWVPNPFAKGMKKATFTSRGQPSYVRLMQLGEKAGADQRERSIVAAAVIENLSYQDLVIVKGWSLQMMALKDGRVEVRLGRGNFSACAAIQAESDAGPVAGADGFDCPAGHPTFQAFARSKTAQEALSLLMPVEALIKAREQFSETTDKPGVAPYHRGQSINAAEGRAMLECLTGACRDEVIKDKLVAADKAVTQELAKEARSRSKRSKGSKAPRVAVEQDPAAAEEERLRKAAQVNGADLKRMAALQSALGTVRLPLPEVSTPPGRASQLDVKAAAKVIGRGQRGITACVSRAMTRGQSMFGELRARIGIQPSGRVASVEIMTEAYKGADVSRCIQGKVRRWRFPSFPGKEIVPVEVPWKLPKR